MTTFPTLNLNGTSGDRLQEPLLDILDAIRALRKAMSEATPHGRDYQTMPAGSYEQAAREHRRIFGLADTIEGHFTSVAVDVQRQILDRERK